jgi:NADH dehydrogenase [ubiquinone] 1 alpha subcomplex assembly factor 1
MRISVLDLARSGSDAGWREVHDRVMGGHSRGDLRRNEAGHAVFAGHVSLEAGGGFASVRRALDGRALPGCTGFLLRVRGDGKRYRLTAGATEAPSPATWAFAFETRAGTWVEVAAPLAAFVHRVHGREVPAPPLEAAAIRSIGFVVGDRQEGPFRLEIARIETA